jgi:hypothetical protein
MGIRFFCPNGHKLNVKAFLAGQKGICPYCGCKVDIPLESVRSPSKQHAQQHPQGGATPSAAAPSAAVVMPHSFEEPFPMPAQPDEAAPHMSEPAAPPASSAGAAAPPAMPPKPAAPAPASVPAESAAAPVAIPLSAAAAAPSHAAPAAPSAPTPPAVRSSGPPDPLLESPDAVWYIRPPSGGQFGPAVATVMRTWLQEGRISADSLVWREGWRDWQEAIGVFPQLRGDDLAVYGAAIPALAPVIAAAPAAEPAVQPVRRPQSHLVHVLIIVALVVILCVLVGVLYIVWQPGAAEKPKTSACEPGRCDPIEVRSA